jgi:hypothetical protein
MRRQMECTPKVRLERIVEGEGGSQVARITVAWPDNLESVTGISEFLVLESEISDEVE